MLLNLILIEEAHEVVRGADERSDLSEGIVGIFVREARKYGFGLMLVDQTPALLPGYLTSNCHTRICLGVLSGEDARAVGGMMALTQAQRDYLMMLPPRAAVTHYPSFHSAFIMAARGLVPDGMISEEEIEAATQRALERLAWQEKAQQQKVVVRLKDEGKDSPLPWDEQDYLMKVAKDPLVPATARDQANHIPLARGNALRQRLRAKGMVEEARVNVGKGGQVLVVAPSTQGWRYLESIGAPGQKPPGRGGLAHCFGQFTVASALAKRYPRAQVRIEDGSVGKSVDVSLVVEEEGQVLKAAFELLVKGEGKEISNIVQDLDVGYTTVTVCCETLEALESLRERCRRELKEEEWKKVRFSLLGEFWKEE